VKVGLFGGAFDPVHNAHLFIAEAVRAQCGLERVIFLPTLNAHHRESITASVDDRAQMLRLAIASNPAFALDLTDTTPEATGYTADLIPRLRARYPDERFTFIAGGDSLVRSPWRRLDEVLAQVDAFVVAPRGDSSVAQLDATLAPFAADLRAKVAMLDLPRFTESATIMRTRLAEGRTVRYLVPEPVWRFIEEHGLYQSQALAP
jgi:nicotinate-nucleotide adenylyltransferase